MASVRDRIIAAAVAALNNAANQPPCTTFRTRPDAANEPELPLMICTPVSEEVQRVNVSTVERQLTLRVEAMTAGAPPQDAALDPLLTYAVTALAADPAFRGLIQGFVDAKVMWEVQAGDTDRALGAIDFKVTYSTALDDPTALKSKYAALVYVSVDGATWYELGELADLQFELSTATVDATNLESSGDEYLATVPAWKATARELYLAGDVPQSSLLDACLAGSLLYFRFDPAGTAAGLDRLSGRGLVSGVKFAQQPSPNQPVWQNLQFQGSGALARSEQQ